MADQSAIRMGGAYVEITADDSPLKRRLEESQTRLRRWVADNQGGVPLTRGSEAQALGGEEKSGFLRGGFRGMQLFDTGMKFATAVAAVKVAMADVHVFSALVRGDMDGMRKAAESLPFGLGEITKELGAAADEAAKFVMTWLGHDMKGAYDPAATARADKDRAAQAKAYNTGIKAIADTETALKKATLSAAEFAKVEVDAMGLSADQAEKLLGLKLSLIAADERRKLGVQQQALIERGESALGQAMDQYMKLTMSEKDFIAYEVRHMGLAENHAKSLLNWKLAILQVTEEQALAEKRQKFDVAMGESLEAVKTRVAEIRGTMDALAAEQERALKPIYEAVGAGTISFDEAKQKTDELKAAFGELRKAQEAATAKKAGEDLTESMRTPEEKARDEIARYKRMLDAGTISQETYSRAVRKSIEDAAATLPDAVKHTIGVRGTFNAMEAAGLGAGGASDRIAQASEKTAKNTEKIAQVIKDLGLSFN